MLRQQLFKSFYQVAGQLAESFTDVAGLQKTLQVIDVDSLGKQLYNGYDAVVQKIYDKDITFLKEQASITDLLYLREIFPLLTENETSSMWDSLQVIVRYVGIINTTGSSLTNFENIAKKFMAKNKGMDQQQCQSALLTQMFTDPELSSEITSMFDDENGIYSLLQNVDGITKAMGVPDLRPEDSKANEEEEDEEEEEEEEEEEKKKQDSSKLSVIMKKRRKKHRKTKKKISQMNIASLGDMVKQVDIKKEDIKELKAGVEEVLSGNKIGEMTEQLAGMKRKDGSFDPSKLQDIIKTMNQGQSIPGIDMNAMINMVQSQLPKK